MNKTILSKIPNYWVFVAYMIMLFLTFSFIGCFREQALGSSGGNGNLGDTITFEIPKGAHYPTPKLNQIGSTIKSMSFYCEFDSSVIYKINDNDSNDINKVYGYSWGYHHDYSCRLGFNWKNNGLMLYNYSYFNSQVKSKKINKTNNLKLKVPIYCSISFTGDSTSTVSIVQNGVGQAAIITVSGVYGTTNSVCYFLYPYFGGQKTAPQRIRIKIWGVRIQTLIN